ncbi:Uncharacterised protein [Mycobacteroides abscessus subsp. abscessus]|nr:Uncharacterised protein [Mycobacteroides abscessus subsp. abscessus]
MPRSGIRSGHEMSPTLSLPSSDITVTVSAAPWKIGPSGYMPMT